MPHPALRQLALLAGLLLLLAACSGAAASRSAAKDDSPGSIYLVQEAGSADLSAVPTTAGEFTLTLSEVAPGVAYFGDATTRIAGIGDNRRVLETLFHDATSHDAALDWSAPTGRGTLVVTLLSGDYDAGAATATYRVRVLEDVDPSSVLAGPRGGTQVSSTPGRAATAATTLPVGISQATLFIDPLVGTSQMTCSVTIVNNAPFYVGLGSFDGNAEWVPPMELNPGQTWSSGPVSPEDGVDCHFYAQFGGPDGMGFDVNMADPPYEATHWDCATTGNPRLTCQSSGNEWGQPANITFTISFAFTG